MAADSVFEQRLLTLIAQFKTLKKTQRALTRRISDQERTIRDLKGQCKSLRDQLDALGKNRFTVKQLKEERDQIRAKLALAIDRLTAMEREC